MRLGTVALAIVAAALAPSRASAVETYSSSQFHQIIAKAVVPDRNNEQLYFSVVAGTFWTPEIERYAASDGAITSSPAPPSFASTGTRRRRCNRVMGCSSRQARSSP
jgi:hypothetical protein